MPCACVKLTSVACPALHYFSTYLTLAKNATKLNPFENITLQTTRKENNWKTEEALARAAVTLETERIKGSNP